MSEKTQPPQDPNDRISQPQRVVNIFRGNYNESIGGNYIQNSIETVNQWFSKLLGQDLEAESNRILEKILKAVRTEVRGRLRGILQQDSLQINQYLELSFQEQGEEVGRDIRSKVFELPPETNIIEVFEHEDVDGRLLILGEPGSGKTTSLLKLATELITQAKPDSNKPIPVIFELSTWKKDQQPIDQWLIEQLKDNYSIDFKVSQKWIKQNRILPLLDGLDELGSTRQKLAIDKINQYLQQDTDRKLVVCCRGEEYKQGEIKLYQLRGAYYLQPPTESDIRDYLERLNQQDLWQKIEDNPEMRELAQKPFFLNSIMTAFQGKAIVSKSELFSNYVEEQLRRPLNLQKYPQGKLPYSNEDTKKWLTYLAGQLEADNLTVFLIEKMQPYWLNPGIERWAFSLILELILWESKNIKSETEAFEFSCKG